MILLVSHDSRDRHETSRILRQAGYEVREESMGLEALRVAEELPELVLLDVNLADINGFEVRRRIKANPHTSAIPVVHLSAVYPSDADRITALSEGAEACLNQPVDALDLLATVKICLRLKASQAAVHQLDSSYRALVESASDGIFCTGADGGFLDANAAGCRMLGHTREELLALNIRDFIAPDEIARVAPEIARVQAGQVVHSEWPLLRQDGTLLPCGVDATALPNGRLLSIVRDFTASKHLEKLRRDQEQELLEAQRIAGMGSWEWTPASNTIYWSDGLKRILRRDPALPTPTFDTLARFYTAESWERLLAEAARIMETGSPGEFELEMIRDDGTTVWQAVRDEALRGTDGSITAIRGIVLDIDERKRAELSVQHEKDFNQIVVNSLPGLFYLIDEQGQLLRSSQSIKDLSGYSSEEISVMSFLDLFNEKQKRLVAEHVQQAFSEGNGVVEASLVSKDQIETVYLFNSNRFTFEGKACLAGFGIDITERKQAEKLLRDSASKHRVLFEEAADANLLMSENGFLDCNEAALKMFGYSSKAEFLALRPDEFSPQDQPDGTSSREGSERNIAIAFLNGKNRFEWVHRRKNGETFPSEVCLTALTLNGRPSLLGMVRDITDRRRAEKDLRLTQFSVEHASEAIFWFNPQAHIIYVNEAACRSLGYSREELLSLSLWDFDPLFPKEAWETFRSELKARGSVSFESQHRTKHGNTFLVEISANYRQFDGMEYAFAFVRDITERKRTEKQLTELARYDPLTGLANRAVFVESLDRAIARVRRGAQHFAVLYLDLDHFKDVNDTLGHPIGDLLLQAVAKRLQASVREVDLVARFGGDEFAIILDAISDPVDIAGVVQRILDAIAIQQCASAAVATADKILKAFSEPFSIQSNEIRSGATIGIAIYGPDSPDAETILTQADLALYRAKSEARGSYRFFTEAMDIEVRARVQLNTELREAIARNQLFLMYQPQVDIETGSIVGLEALVRWHHPRRGALGPGKFIPLAETNGLILPLGRWVMRAVCRQIRQWLDAGIALPTIAINLSGVQFKDGLQLESDIRASLSESGLPARLLELELTESVLMTASRDHNDLLVRLREKGHRITIDDFGSGYSSLDYLRRFPADRIKIAQSFTADLGVTSGSDAIVKAAIGLAHELGMKVVVEGVETAMQVALLKALNCRIVQGYYFSRPLPVPEMTTLLSIGRITPANPDVIGTPALAVS
ncbi:MAG TPA: EAL domain-containing protein [Bryobacteraceae bacterium]|nr:EAL domain-containing protein [Bryobacteraceae bacterium]